MTDPTTLQIDQHEAQVEALKRRLAGLEAERDALKAEKAKAIAGQAIAAAAAAAGIPPQRIQSAVWHALLDREWRTGADGKVVLLAADGHEQYQNGEVITPAVFMRTMRQDAYWFWSDDAGAPADPTGNQQPATATHSSGAADNPWTETAWNITRQSEIFARDPQKAESLARDAGVSVYATKPAGSGVPRGLR